MTDEVWKRKEIASPCIKICLIHPEARICTGCYRTAEEITIWSRLTDEARASVMEALPARAGQLSIRRGGRRAKLSSQSVPSVSIDKASDRE